MHGLSNSKVTLVVKHISFFYFRFIIGAVVPRSRPLPIAERQVCARLIEFRKARGLSRAEVARVIGINRFSLASVESGKAPVRFPFGYAICDAFNLSLRWLATGAFPQSPFTPISPTVLQSIDPKTLFSSAYRKQLSGMVENRLRSLAKENKEPLEKLGEKSLIFDYEPLGVSGADGHLEQVVNFIHHHANQMDDAEKNNLAHRLSDTVFAVAVFGKGKTSLPRKSLKSNTVSVQQFASVEDLIAAVNKKASAPGGKAELARVLGVAPARVSEWLSGKKEPGGNYTLQMLAWLNKKD